MKNYISDDPHNGLPPPKSQYHKILFDIADSFAEVFGGRIKEIPNGDVAGVSSTDQKFLNALRRIRQAIRTARAANEAAAAVGAVDRKIGNLEYLELEADSLIDEANKLLHQIGNIMELPYPDLVTASNAVDEKAEKKLDRQTKYDNGDWEMWHSEADGGGHWFWTKATNTLSFEGFNNDSGSKIVWERYIIDGGGENFSSSGGTRIGTRFMVAWDGVSRGHGQLRFYYTKGKSDSTYSADDEVASQIWVRDLLAGELGRPLPAVNTHADLLALADMRINDWIYVQDDTYDPGDGTPVHVGETWAYAYDGAEWVELVRINEIQIQDDDATLTVDPASGRRKVKEGGIGATQLAAGAATDTVIGDRTLADQTGSGTLVPIDARGLTAWLQGIRNNLKALFSGKQDTLVSGGNIKTLSGRSILGAGDLPIGMSLPYKGASNQAGILIDLGSAVAGGNEILFDLLYNETQSGNLIRQAHIHGQLYGGVDNRHGMVQNGNINVPVFAFKGTEEGIGTLNTYLWIPSSDITYFPSLKADVWSKSSTGIFDSLPVTISTLSASPRESLVEIAQISSVPGGITASKTYGNIPGANVPPVGVSVKLGATSARFYFGTVSLRQNSTGKEVKFDYGVYAGAGTAWDYLAVTKIINDYRVTSVWFYKDNDGNIFLYLDLVAAANIHYFIEATCMQTGSGANGIDDVNYRLLSYKWETATPAFTNKTATKTVSL
jgi:hypothetical protein